mmetsp:Transcript_94281/g.224485  ORF Transcript_94281/g.224485 Transcript_94281/m.224485 type:complete len:237 (+) Transcript_94281:776-1486(+)
MHGFAQQPLGEQHRLLRRIAPSAGERDASRLDLLFRCKGHGAAHQVVHDDATSPDVAAVGVLPVQNLRGHVGQRAHLVRHHGSGPEGAGQAKVRDLQQRLGEDVGGGDQDVLRLEIPVADEVPVEVEHSSKHLKKRHSCLLLCEASPTPDAVQQGASGADLHDEAQKLIILEDLIEHDDVRVIHRLHDLNLLLQHVQLLLHPLNGDKLGRALRLGRQHIGAFHHSEAALAQGLALV